ncbi:glutathione S-transferase [Shimia gijangensis]|uniref:Glutathione S-transferase n=1 Tax=Shimia gijangensis TaxID=1470563 RepID=A0A1M6NMC2_9RHOB|nr:glutathione S-transferase family protein [Shimia gijangensis]SHJ96879.1 glutathione S-transferase [Shimia gijangensis]
MIFYDCSTAPSPRRARMLIAEKGIDVEKHDVSLAKEEQLSAEFLAINSGATVPVLITETGVTLTENLGIAAYLEARFPEPALMGNTPDDKGAILMWTAIAEGQCGLAVAEALRNSNPHMKDRAIPGPENFEQIPQLAERGLRRIDLFFDKLDQRLQGRDFIATQDFSLADITAFVLVDFARVVQKRVSDTHPDLKRWYEAVKSRPSAQL